MTTQRITAYQLIVGFWCFSNARKWLIGSSRHSNLRKLHNETMFLVVNLYDRLLARGFCFGFFRSRSNLQVLGIACLTLATRIEENQPMNRFYLKAAKADKEMENRAKYLAVLSLIDHEQLCY